MQTEGDTMERDLTDPTQQLESKTYSIVMVFPLISESKNCSTTDFSAQRKLPLLGRRVGIKEKWCSTIRSAKYKRGMYWVK